jgi:hypothetical protein
LVQWWDKILAANNNNYSELLKGREQAPTSFGFLQINYRKLKFIRIKWLKGGTRSRPIKSSLLYIQFLKCTFFDKMHPD